MINLGDRVRDKITQFTGIAIEQNECITGCNTVYVETEFLESGKLKSAKAFSELRLEVIESQIFENNSPHNQKEFSFGSKVRDIITGFQGIVTGRSSGLSGFTRYHAESDQESAWMGSFRLEKVGKSIVSIEKKKVGCNIAAPFLR